MEMCVKRTENIIIYLHCDIRVYYVPMAAATYGYKTRNRYSVFLRFYTNVKMKICKSRSQPAVHAKSEKIFMNSARRSAF